MSLSKPSKPKLRIVIDWGTTHWKAAVHIGPPGSQTTTRHVVLVHDTETLRAEFPMVAGYFDGTFKWGQELLDLLNGNALEEDPVVYLHKLALHNNHQTAALTQDVYRTLGGPDKLVSFMADFMRRVLNYIVEWTKNYVDNPSLSCEWELDGTPVDEMEQEVQMTVPLIFGPDSTKKIMDAADQANFPMAELVPEPIAAAAWILARLQEPHNTFIRATGLAKNSKVMCLDVGGGTTDIVTLRIEHDPKAGATAKLAVVDRPKGALCGSYLINQAFTEWLSTCKKVEKKGGLDEICNSLGLTHRGFFAKMSRAFDHVKAVNPWPPASSVAIIANNITFSVDIPFGVMQSFFEPIVDEVIEVALAALIPGTEVIYLIGGLANSSFFTKRMETAFVNKGVKIRNEFRIQGHSHEPCASGPILRYSGIAPRDFPSQYCFGIGRAEEPDPVLHPDAYTTRYRVHPRSGMRVLAAKEDYDVVKKDWVDPNLNIVEKRWVTLLPQNAMPKDGYLEGKSAWRFHYFEEGDDEISEDIYWSDISISDHAAIEDKDGNRAHGIHVWARTVIKFSPGEHGYQLIPNTFKKRGSKIYELYSRVRIMSQGAKTEVLWEFLIPDIRAPFNILGRQYRDDPDDSLYSQDSHRVSIRSELRNPFTHDQYKTDGEQMEGVEQTGNVEKDENSRQDGGAQEAAEDTNGDAMDTDMPIMARGESKQPWRLPDDEDE